ncbi:hypothetical protein NQ317_019625 [Molorchus minor]|uniref:Uncharacterized protein n=1 Tax=Molorchus minor TaxID=1323400 RepID=A0ABQ9JLN0_9CUCU|nr:hypothetical protein NQ317_019625 [Molorchus minor]
MWSSRTRVAQLRAEDSTKINCSSIHVARCFHSPATGPHSSSLDPPTAPEPYRQKDKAFAIIGEVDQSRPSSRSPSPTGRVSPFPFGERIYHGDSSPTRDTLNNKHSQSLTNLNSKNSSQRPPPSPRKNVNRTLAFQKLSPIAGSSPEPSQSMSSPSRIPKSRSTPPTRRNSPTRHVGNKPPPARNTSRAVSRSNSTSRSQSRSQSTTRDEIPLSPTRASNKYKNSEDSDITRNVANKPSLSRRESVNKIRTNSKLPRAEIHNSNNSINKINTVTINTTTTTTTHTTPTTTTTTGNNSDSSSSINSKHNNIGAKINTSNKPSYNTEAKTVNGHVEESGNKGSPQKESNSPPRSPQKENKNSHSHSIGHSAVNGKSNNNESRSSSPIKKPAKENDAVIDSQASHGIKEVKNGNKEDYSRRAGSPVKFAGMAPSTTAVIDQRRYRQWSMEGFLSATSVSNAMNRMNDTVLNTKTLMNDHSFSRMSASTNPITSIANNTTRVTNPALDTKNATTALPKVDPIPSRSDNKVTPMDVTVTGYNRNGRDNNYANHITHGGVVSAKALEMEVQKNMGKLITPEHIKNNSMEKSINERIREARTMVASDVKPIRITVREKPSDAEVQSGNVRLPVSVSNGVNERPGRTLYDCSILQGVNVQSLRRAVDEFECF